MCGNCELYQKFPQNIHPSPNSLMNSGKSNCNSFRPVLTERGLCYAMNSKDMAEVYTKNRHLDALRKHIITENDDQDEIVKINASGYTSKMTFKFDIGQTR